MTFPLRVTETINHSSHKNISYVIFNKFIRVKILDINILSDSILYYEDLLKDKSCSQENIIRLTCFNDEINRKHLSLMKLYFEKLRNSEYKDNEEIIKKTILENTYYGRGCEEWDITNLAIKYNISGKDVFIALVSNSLPYGIGQLSYKKDKNSLDELNKEWDRREIKAKEENYNYVYFDWHNGIGIKNKFPIDMHHPECQFILNMRRFNDRNRDSGYNKILDLLNQRINESQV